MQHIILYVAAAVGLLGEVQTQSSTCELDGVVGQCISALKCPHLNNLLQSIKTYTAPSGALQILRRAICDQEDGRVCCIPQTQKPLSDNCGVIPLSIKIIDGEDSDILAWPWMALLWGKNQEGRGRYFCGGSLIHERYILTAAHCVDPSSGFTVERVRIGEHTVGTNPDCQNGLCKEHQDILVEEIIQHEQYQNPKECSTCNDIALLRLAWPAKIDGVYVAPVCLPVDPLNDLGYSVNELPGNLAWITGWGATSASDRTAFFSNVLQQAIVPIVNDQLCELEVRGVPNPNMVICAGGAKKDSCRGDSGGPLILANMNGTRMFVVGVTASGQQQCGRVNSGSIYTSVMHHMDWLLTKLQQ